MPRKKITHGGTPVCGLGGPGSGLTAGASLRKATLIECDPALAVCARLLTIEIFLTRNIGLRQTQRARAAQDVFQVSIPGLPEETLKGHIPRPLQFQRFYVLQE